MLPPCVQRGIDLVRDCPGKLRSDPGMIPFHISEDSLLSLFPLGLAVNAFQVDIDRAERDDLPFRDNRHVQALPVFALSDLDRADQAAVGQAVHPALEILLQLRRGILGH